MSGVRRTHGFRGYFGRRGGQGKRQGAGDFRARDAAVALVLDHRVALGDLYGIAAEVFLLAGGKVEDSHVERDGTGALGEGRFVSEHRLVALPDRGTYRDVGAVTGRVAEQGAPHGEGR